MNIQSTYKKIVFCSFFLITIFQLGFSQTKKINTNRPNIIIILMDDMGYGDIGVNGALNYQTPNINKLASEGMRFTNFLVGQPVCTASRAALMTGCYPNRINLTGALMPNSDIGINASEILIPEMLKSKGYKTSMIGKWHLGDSYQFLPLQNGFDNYYGIPYSNDMWPMNFDGTSARLDSLSPKRAYPQLPIIEGNKTVAYIQSFEDQDKITTDYTNRAIQYIYKSDKKPFFLYLAHSMTHVPLGVSEKFKGKSQQGMYGDVMMEVDWSIGKIMKALVDKGIEKNTLIIFTSDNGPWLKFGNHAGTNGGFREGKGTPYEGGQRVACIMRWKGIIPEGTICNKLTSTIDLFPTIANLVGAKLPEHKIDGIDISVLIKGDINANPRKYFYYYYSKNDLRAVRRDNWKLMLPIKHDLSNEIFSRGMNRVPGETGFRDISLSLYDLANDPNEFYDVKNQYPEILTELLKVAEAARNDLGDNLLGIKPSVHVRPAGKVNL
jgi:arylsulfatase